MQRFWFCLFCPKRIACYDKTLFLFVFGLFYAVLLMFHRPVSYFVLPALANEAYEFILICTHLHSCGTAYMEICTSKFYKLCTKLHLGEKEKFINSSNILLLYGQVLLYEHYLLFINKKMNLKFWHQNFWPVLNPYLVKNDHFCTQIRFLTIDLVTVHQNFM